MGLFRAFALIRVFVLRLSVVSWLLIPVAIAAQPARSDNVVLVTLDGSRWQEIFTGLDESLLKSTLAKGVDMKTLDVYRDFSGATPAERREKLMPFLWRTLAAEHGFIAGDRTNASEVSVTNRLWFSYPGYAEILTGQAHDAEITSNDAIRNPFPTVMQFVRRQLQLPAAKVATFASWNVFNAIAESVEGETTVNAGVEPYQSDTADGKALAVLQGEASTPWENTRHDAFTFRIAMDYLKRERPRLLYIAFDETDDWAHDGHYDRVLKMLHQSDGYLRELWTTLQSDPQYKGRTTLIVTADHGRGRTEADWRKHGKDVQGASEIWIAIASPGGSRRGAWRDHPPLFQNQIAATIAAAFGLDYGTQNPQAGKPIQ